jgi:hypothetical protein
MRGPATLLTFALAGCSLLFEPDGVEGQSEPPATGDAGDDHPSASSDANAVSDGASTADASDSSTGATAKYLYVIGGEYRQGDPPPDVLRAEIEADGKLKSWIPASSSWASDRLSFSGVFVEGRLFVAGGRKANGDYVTTVESVLPGAPLAAPEARTALNGARARHGVVFANGRIWALGGINATGELRSTESTKVAANGDVEPWFTGVELPEARYFAAVTSTASHLVVAGGAASVGQLRATVYVAEAKTDGAWSTATALPKPLSSACAVTVGGRVYVMGGQTLVDAAQVVEKSVYYATISTSGQIGTWATTSSLNVSHELHACVAVGDRIYVAGGHDGLPLTESVEYATVNADGTLSPWTTTSALPYRRAAFALVATP